MEIVKVTVPFQYDTVILMKIYASNSPLTFQVFAS